MEQAWIGMESELEQKWNKNEKSWLNRLGRMFLTIRMYWFLRGSKIILADNSKEQEWNKNESVPILHTTELEQEWNKNDFLEQKWNKNGPFLFNFRLQCRETYNK